jgi:carbon storage regulator
VLILSRRAGESIVIGDDIVITVVEASRDVVRIGIDAPRSISVHRQEVYAEIARENERARHSDPLAAPHTANRPVSPSSLTSGIRRPRR